jgi:alkylation response protein AidB-like acyl-CoA dehydrogenase
MDYFDLNLNLSKEDIALKKETNKFALEVMRPISIELDQMTPEEGIAPESPLWDFFRQAYELDYHKITFPDVVGGPGLTPLQINMVMEELAWGSFGLTLALNTSLEAAVAMGGSEKLVEEFTIPYCQCKDGSYIGCWAITEPDHGSDSLVTGYPSFRDPKIPAQCTARLDGDEYVISGNKMFVSNANLADFLVVLCITDPENPRKHHRLSTVIVETNRPGYEANKLHGKLSIRCSDTGEVALKEVRVPQENLVGTEGKGFYQLMDFFNRARLDGGGALAIGTAQGALEKSIRHVKQRKALGNHLAGNQIVQAKIAEMATLLEAGRSLLYRAALKVDNGEVDPALIAMAKWYTCEIAVKVADEAIQLHGGYGILKEYDVEHYWRDAKVFEIFEGAKEIEKILIARRLLGRY